jgi:hypothetical protein
MTQRGSASPWETPDQFMEGDGVTLHIPWSEVLFGFDRGETLW